jgi:hypothetical protein
MFAALDRMRTFNHRMASKHVPGLAGGAVLYYQRRNMNLLHFHTLSHVSSPVGRGGSPGRRTGDGGSLDCLKAGWMVQDWQRDAGFHGTIVSQNLPSLVQSHAGEIAVSACHRKVHAMCLRSCVPLARRARLGRGTCLCEWCRLQQKVR